MANELDTLDLQFFLTIEEAQKMRDEIQHGIERALSLHTQVWMSLHKEALLLDDPADVKRVEAVLHLKIGKEQVEENPHG